MAKYEIEFESGGKYIIDSSTFLRKNDYISVANAIDVVLKGHRKVWPYESYLTAFIMKNHISLSGRDSAGEFRLDRLHPELSAIYLGKNKTLENARKCRMAFIPMLTLVAAHEARHLVQFLDGEHLEGAPYTDPRLEDEAWIAAVNALAYIYPNSTGSFSLSGGRTYQIPEVSIYEDLRKS